MLYYGSGDIIDNKNSAKRGNGNMGDERNDEITSEGIRRTPNSMYDVGGRSKNR